MRRSSGTPYLLAIGQEVRRESGYGQDGCGNDEGGSRVGPVGAQARDEIRRSGGWVFPVTGYFSPGQLADFFAGLVGADPAGEDIYFDLPERHYTTVASQAAKGNTETVRHMLDRGWGAGPSR
jgi:hypothetical protein